MKKPSQSNPQSLNRAAFRRESILLEDGSPFGRVMDSWQAEDFAALDSGEYRHAFWERPRGHSKTGDIGTEVVTELVLGPPRQKLFCVAADEDQGRLLFEDVAEKFHRHPMLRGLVKVTRNEITVKSGSRLKVLTHDAPSAYGLRPDWIALDEVAEWRKRDLWDSLWTATGKRKHCRVLVITSAGWDRTSIAWEVRSNAERESNWHFSPRGQCASWVDPAWLAQQQRTLPAHVFARLHESRWVDGVGAWLTAQQVDAIFAGALPEGDGPRVIGLDIGYARDRSAVAVLRRCGPLAVFDHLEMFRPTKDARVDLGEVQDAVEVLARKYHAPVWYDPFQGVLMAEQLQKRGCAVKEYPFTGESRKKLFATLADHVTAGRLRARPHEELRRELLQLEVKQTAGGNWRVEHRASGFDDCAVAVALALQGLPDAAGNDDACMGVGARASGAVRHGGFEAAPVLDWAALPIPGDW